ncbi:cation-translocating P-type ATPase [Acholeplasma equirhinis]|uniref:cation-translocating P-type ATPase n=1 Tax=Acholeplasma equirhinis TaxID=555393 RepID=UPI00197A908D|nr:cation-translocating P-type ATPase [Acholeplasma equirhinis]MBN3490473.1 cation-translocating P-type ATPase [Acholeplasma equirhinis]
MEKNTYQQTVDETFATLQTTKNGLSSNEVQLRIERFGKNELIAEKKRPIFLKFLDQFKDFMVIVLLIAAGIAFVAAILEQKPEELTEGLLIVGIVLINAIIGVVQEAKADEALESIKKMSSPHATVLRDGVEIKIDVKDLVPGDIVILQAGDFVPADLRLIEVVNLKCDESPLTGEAVPVEKDNIVIQNNDVPLGDRINLAYMGTVVTYGRGAGVVISSGMQTEIGKIASMLNQSEKSETPLQKSIAQLGKTLALLALIIVGIIFAIQITRGLINGELHILESFMSAIALAVAAIPEGLPAIITIVLSIGMQNLVKKKAIMRTLPAVETLGSTSIICSDKTGTLTQNIMTVTDLYVNGQTLKVSEIKKPTSELEMLIDYSVLCNDTIVKYQDNQYLKIGDPTEIALTDLSIQCEINPIAILEKYPRVFELPFDSDRKMMTTVHKIDDQYVSITKGAPDVIFGKSSSYYHDETVKPFDESTYLMFNQQNTFFTDQALRVLAIAFKLYPEETVFDKNVAATLENNLTLLGLVGMIDPARPEVKDAIKETKRAGITTIMITGDHKNTAVAIAKELGILIDDNLAITGKELDKMSDEEYFAKLKDIRVYARVSPENKVRIVEAWKQTGLVVAMTGDGVNDAPSIKKADIGIAMGITGTEVAKGASDMILTDDNFATIVTAVGEGRAIFANIKKAIHFLLSCNIGEIITIFLGVTLGLVLFPNEPFLQILSASQILWVNLVTDSLMAIGLGLEPKEDNIMDESPRDSKKSIFSGGLGFKIAWQGILIGSITFLAFYIGYQMNGIRHAQTLTFMVLAITQLFHAFNVRSEMKSAFNLGKNKFLIFAFIGCFLLQLLTVFVPFIAENVFDIDSVYHWDLTDWLIVLGLSIIPVIIVEITKIFKKSSK